MLQSQYESTLSVLDWAAVLIYVALMMAAAFLAHRANEKREDYFVAGRSMNWIVLSVAIFAALFSTLSFVSVPGEAYENGLMFSLIGFGALLFIPLGIWLFLRFFFMSKSFTAYEYLEQRFNLPTRLFGAGIFTLMRIIYIGSILYSAAEIFKSLVGWNPVVTILVLGLFSITYATLVGMRTLIWSDIINSVVICIGAIVLVVKVIMVVNFDFSGVYNYAGEHGRGFGQLFDGDFYKLDLHARLNFWLLLASMIMVPLMSLSSDQLYIQRLLSSKGYKDAKKAVWGSNLFGLPVVVMLWFIGIAIFYFYGKNPEKLPTGMGSDQVLGYFINTQLAQPMPGIVVASLIAALVSTVNSVINSLATVIYCDGFLRLGFVKENNRNEMVYCRLLSILSGVLGLAFALFLVFAGKGIKGNVFEITSIWSSLWGVLVMTFVLGVLTVRVSGAAMVWGIILGGFISLVLPYVLYYMVPSEQRISFMWIAIPGQIAVIVVPLLISLVFPNKKLLLNLTLWTLEGKIQPK